MASDCSNLTLHTDKYQINMMYAHWVQGTMNERAVFEAYFRRLPFGNGYAVFAGLERIVQYIRELKFGEEEIAFLRTQPESYPDEFLDALRQFRFTGHLDMVPEGTLVFPNEPLIRVEARLFEAQLIETAMLNFMNFQTLIATKASRIKQVAQDDILLEFGTRRAQEADAALWGARASYIAGFDATSNMRAGVLFGIPVQGTHSHAWVQSHASEADAFRQFAEALPDHVTLLVDTYDTLRSGVPNAIETARWLESQGRRLNAIRLDSGDLAYLSQQSRAMLDEAGLPYVKIVASGDLDENIIFDLKAQGARIDSWGVGTQLITAADQPALGGVYKLTAIQRGDRYEPVIKLSANPGKVTNPGHKALYRLINRKNGMAEADYLALPEETEVQLGKRVRVFDPVHSYLFKFVDDYEAVPLLKRVFEDGKLVYDLPALSDIRAYHQQQLRLFWPEYLRKLNPETYRVSLSEKLWQLKAELIERHRQAGS